MAPQPYTGPSAGTVPPATARRRKKRHPIRRTLLTLLLLWLVFLIGTPVHAVYESTTVDAMPEGKRPAPQPGTAILLVGSDSREGLSAKQKKKLGTGSISGRRTDTMMLLYSPPSGKPALISLPRDSYLPIPGRGKHKLNAAYAYGGPQLLIKTIEQNTGVRIDGYVEIGFGGFAGVVDAVGGVTVCPKKPIKDRDSHLNLPAGCQTLDGATSLGYVRMRKADPRGDLGRMERQREVVGKIMKKVASPMSVINPVRYWQIWHSGMSSVNRADETGIVQLGTLGLSLRRLAAGDG
ncbi:MAG: transcriptional regulator, partial [Propionibacteriales bacterium]